MSDPTNWRIERVTQLLRELEYEVGRGIMEGDFESERLSYIFVVPVSREDPEGVVLGRFTTLPVSSRYCLPDFELEAELKAAR